MWTLARVAIVDSWEKVLN